MRFVFIVNPVADRGKAQQVWASLQEESKRLHENAKVIFTEYPGHAQDIASSILEADCDAVISVGGDGTIHEIVNGIAGRDIAIGIIPAGSGNDLARTLGISRDHGQALRNLSIKK